MFFVYFKWVTTLKYFEDSKKISAKIIKGKTVISCLCSLQGIKISSDSFALHQKYVKLIVVFYIIFN